VANFRAEPYLWIHLAGIACAPLTLQLAWLGLAIGDPLPWYGLELGILSAIAILPILWMQVARPFDFFSLGAVALRPEVLTLEQRRTLSRLKTRQHRILSVIVAIAFGGLAWQIYQLAPLASPVMLELPQWRLLGLGISAVALFFSHLFIQVPASVLAILSISRDRWLATPIFEPSAISLHFTVAGWRVNRLPPIPSPPEALTAEN
jgi:hypothetical protein